MSLFSTLGRTALFTLDPETAHHLSIKALKSGLLPSCSQSADPRLRVQTCGLTFANPVGIAAGYDKNGEVPDAILKLGFGFCEIGSVTPLPQSGNEKPRIFRLPEDQGVINRLGFNNHGHAAVLSRLETRGNRAVGPLGINVGANKDSADRTKDYVLGIETFYAVADYFTINISSPNTPGLRDYHARDSLAGLLEAVMEARDKCAGAGEQTKPIFLKIAPDLAIGDLEDIAAEMHQHALEGLIVSNTTVSRSGLHNRQHVNESGGLSGKPIFERSTIMLAKMRKLMGPSTALIGVGGVDSGADVLEKIRAGADLVQLYTGFIYKGPGLAREILKDLSGRVATQNIKTISELRDTNVDYWAGRNLPV